MDVKDEAEIVKEFQPDVIVKMTGGQVSEILCKEKGFTILIEDIGEGKAYLFGGEEETVPGQLNLPGGVFKTR